MDVNVITDHKPLVAIFKKRCSDPVTMNPANASENSSIQGLNSIQTGPEIFIADWLSCPNHKEITDEAIHGMDIKVDAVQIMTSVPECIWQVHQATLQDKHLQQLKSLIITGWLDTKDQLHQDIRPYWSFKDDLAVIDGVIMKGRCIIIMEVLNSRHWINWMAITWALKKTKLLAHESIYWVNVNNDIKII